MGKGDEAHLLKRLIECGVAAVRLEMRGIGNSEIDVPIAVAQG